MPTNKRDSIAAYITGWTSVREELGIANAIQCRACGAIVPDRFADAMKHHEPTIDHAGVKISQCDERRISQDGP